MISKYWRTLSFNTFLAQLMLLQYLVTVQRERRKVMGTILIVILILMLVGVLPTWPHSRNWGYYPSGGLGLVLLILLILLLLGRI
jgi:hypothetical protein